MLLLLSTFLIMSSTGLFAQSSEDNSPLDPTELRQVLLRLLNCTTNQDALNAYKLSTEEVRKTCAERIQAEADKVDNKQKELDLALQEVELWKGLYNTIKKKKAGFGCWMGRIFTAGHYRCPK